MQGRSKGSFEQRIVPREKGLEQTRDGRGQPDQIWIDQIGIERRLGRHPTALVGLVAAGSEPCLQLRGKAVHPGGRRQLERGEDVREAIGRVRAQRFSWQHHPAEVARLPCPYGQLGVIDARTCGEVEGASW
jgi:hypothetical protein